MFKIFKKEEPRIFTPEELMRMEIKVALPQRAYPEKGIPAKAFPEKTYYTKNEFKKAEL